MRKLLERLGEWVIRKIYGDEIQYSKIQTDAEIKFYNADLKQVKAWVEWDDYSRIDEELIRLRLAHQIAKFISPMLEVSAMPRAWEPKTDYFTQVWITFDKKD